MRGPLPGPVAGRARTGRGTMRWPDGRRYNGLWAADRPDARGTFIWPDGRRYLGPVTAGRAEGEGWCIDLDVTERCRFEAGERVDAQSEERTAASGGR